MFGLSVSGCTVLIFKWIRNEVMHSLKYNLSTTICEGYIFVVILINSI